MSEYGEKHSVSRLVGAPPGYVGYEEGGQLTEAVRRRPYTVVLLDEVEKAHPEVFDVLLQVLDDGRLTDGQGRTVDFRNAIIVLTSNLGSTYIVDPTMSPDSRREAVLSAVRTAFKPEFLNRLDEIVVFDALGQEELARIVDLQVDALRRRLADRRLALDVTPAARDWLARTRLRPGLRRPPAAPPRAVGGRRPAGQGPAVRPSHRRRHRPGRPRPHHQHPDRHLRGRPRVDHVKHAQGHLARRARLARCPYASRGGRVGTPVAARLRFAAGAGGADGLRRRDVPHPAGGRRRARLDSWAPLT
jgi:hypothetical protein